MRTIIFGDTHGCILEVYDLLGKIGYDRSKDMLMSVGDLVDKGPDSAGVVKLFRDEGARVVLGNHDQKHVKYRAHDIQKKANPQYKIPIKWSEDLEKVYRSLSESDLNWLCTLPKTITFGEDKSWILVHAGLQNGLPLAKQDKCLWLRYITKDTGAMIPFDGTPGAPPNGVWWADVWKGPEHVVYGHQPFHELYQKNGTWGIDTGCVHGRMLTALIFEGSITKDSVPQVMQVKAQQVYEKDLINPD